MWNVFIQCLDDVG